jgi:hypothetical protein
MLRGYLLESGWQKAQGYPLVGIGSFYRDVSATGATYISAMTSGVTESSGLDYAIAYGMTAAVLLILCAMFSLSAQRRFIPWPVVMFAMMTGTLAIAGPQGSFLGSIVYYGSLIYILLDEKRPIPDHVIQKTSYNVTSELSGALYQITSVSKSGS